MLTCKDVENLTELFSQCNHKKICCIWWHTFSRSTRIQIWGTLHFMRDNNLSVPVHRFIFYAQVCRWNTRLCLQKVNPRRQHQSMGLICSYGSYDFPHVLPARQRWNGSRRSVGQPDIRSLRMSDGDTCFLILPINWEVSFDKFAVKRLNSKLLPDLWYDIFV